MVVQRVRRVGQEEWRNGLLLLDAWREQVEQARRGQEAGRSLTQGLARNSADAYEDIPRLYSRFLRCERESC